jgi:hypothetical protein
LQAFVGIFLIASFACFVIHYYNTAVSGAVYAIDASRDSRFAQFDFKPFLGMQNLGRCGLLRGGKEIFKLRDSLLFVQLLLVGILNASSGEVIAKIVDELLLAPRTAGAQRIIISA